MLVLKQTHIGFFAYVSTRHGRKLCYIEYGGKFNITVIEGLDNHNIVKFDYFGSHLYFIDENRDFYTCNLQFTQFKNTLKLIDNNVDTFSLHTDFGCDAYFYAKSDKRVYFSDGKRSACFCVAPNRVKEIMIGSIYSLFLYDDDRVDYFEIPKNIHENTFNFEEHSPTHTKHVKHSFSIHQELADSDDKFRYVFYLFNEDKMYMLCDDNFDVKTTKFNKTYNEGSNMYGNITNQYLSLVSESTIDIYCYGACSPIISLPRHNIDCVLLHNYQVYIVTVDGGIYKTFLVETFNKISKCNRITKQKNCVDYKLCK